MVDIGESVENIWGLGGGKIMSHSWMDGQVNFLIPVNFLLVLLFCEQEGKYHSVKEQFLKYLSSSDGHITHVTRPKKA